MRLTAKDNDVSNMADGKCEERESEVSLAAERGGVERGKWDNQVEFVLSCIGYAVGLGNIWRFPYVCMRNGGGAFLIPYFICMAFCGIPLYCIEVSLGQYSSLSPLTVWEFSPIFKGLGWGMMILSVIFSLYYNLLVAWVLYYLGKSFSKELPWATCQNDWNTPSCYRRGDLPPPSNITYSSNITDASTSLLITRDARHTNVSELHLVSAAVTNAGKTSAEEFWQYNVLELSPGIEDLGGVRWQLLICLLVAWLLAFFCLIKGVKSSGKVVYVTATLPYVILLILLVRGLMLPGAMLGIRYFIVPDWKQLLSIKTWAEACLQIFYSLGAGWGGLITMASYNKFNNNCVRDAIIIPVVNCATSFFGGFVIFSIIGFMAHEANVPVPDVISSGPGLAFSAYPEALSRMPVSSAWAILFFAMCLTMGLDTQFGVLETIISGFVDAYPGYLSRWKTTVTAVVCAVQMLLGIIFVSRAGVYFFQIVDWYCAVFALPMIALCEFIAIAWVYGADRFLKDMETMVGYRPCAVWKIFWRFITPALVIAMIVFSIYQTSEPNYGSYVYPRWAILLGWTIGVLPFVPTPVCAIISIYQQEGTLLQRIKAASRPTSAWGPAMKDQLGYDKVQQEMKVFLDSSVRPDSEPCTEPVDA